MSERSLKIYKPQDLDNLLDIDKAKDKTQQECERLLEQTKHNCAALEKKTYDDALAKVHEEQVALFEKSFKKVDSFFENAKNDLNSILKSLCTKLKIEQNSADMLSHILYAEVDKLKIKGNKFTVYGNETVLPQLQMNIKEEYKGLDNIHFDFDIKSDLGDHECLIESEFVMARINVQDFQEKVLAVLSLPSDHL